MVITICRMFIEPCELRWSFIELLHSRKFWDHLSRLTISLLRTKKGEGPPVSPMRYCVGERLHLSQVTVPQLSSLCVLGEDESICVKSMRTTWICAEIWGLRKYGDMKSSSLGASGEYLLFQMPENKWRLRPIESLSKEVISTGNSALWFPGCVDIKISKESKTTWLKQWE